MFRPLRFALLVAALLGLWASAANAARPDVNDPDAPLPDTLTSAHFQVHYNGDPDKSWRLNVMQANNVAAWAERAYAAYVSWGYTPPLNDGDGHSDIYVLEIDAGSWGSTQPDNPSGFTSTAYARLSATEGVDEHKVAHLVFHMFQAATWVPLDFWLREGAAEWASFRLLGFPTTVYADESDDFLPLSEYAVRPDAPLDCVGAHCGDTIYEQGSYHSWPFFVFLGERYGTQIVKDIHDRGPALGDPNALGVDFLTQVLATKGATLADVYNDWTVAAMTGSYAATGLKASAPQTATTMSTGATAGALAPVTVAVNHLSVRYVGVQRGSDPAAPCYAATLTLNVAIPAGVASRPYFYWPSTGSTAVPLALNGSNATLSMPWDTCSWDLTGRLSLPNDSTSADGVEFTVSGSLAVDKTRPTTSTPPPPGAYTGPTVPAPDAEPAPSIALYGPETLRVSKTKRLLRLVVFSSGPGDLEVQLGATMLGKRELRSGNNDLRFTLPKGFVRTLSARNELSVTSISSSGTRGATVTRKLILTK
jgi:hypothetical protein